MTPEPLGRYDVTAQPTRTLLRVWAAIMRELMNRGVVRTFNNPVGDIAEALVAAHFNGKRAGFSQKGWDVRTPTGDLLEVKAMRQTSGRRDRGFSPLRFDADFTAIVAVVFREDFEVDHVWWIPRDIFLSRFPVDRHINGRRLRLTQALLDAEGVEELYLSRNALGDP